MSLWTKRPLLFPGPKLSLDLCKPSLAYVCQQKGHAEDDQQTDKITAAHSKSFHFASGLLPEEKRSAVRFLYAFCRTMDDIVAED